MTPITPGDVMQFIAMPYFLIPLIVVLVIFARLSDW